MLLLSSGLESYPTWLWLKDAAAHFGKVLTGPAGSSGSPLLWMRLPFQQQIFHTPLLPNKTYHFSSKHNSMAKVVTDWLRHNSLPTEPMTTQVHTFRDKAASLFFAEWTEGASYATNNKQPKPHRIPRRAALHFSHHTELSTRQAAYQLSLLKKNVLHYCFAKWLRVCS